MPGIMSAAEMAKRNASTGTAFDKHFLTQMITHGTGAIAMAKTELTDGQDSEAKALANSTIAGQSMEITEMKSLLTTIKCLRRDGGRTHRPSQSAIVGQPRQCPRTVATGASRRRRRVVC